MGKQLACPQWDTGPHERRERATPCPHQRLCSWLWMRTYTASQQPRFSRELVYAKSSTSRWIASRSRKLSDWSVLRVTAPPHRRAEAVCVADIACRACCLELERLTWCNLPADTACRRHAPCSEACRLQQPPWSSPRAGTACRRRASRSALYHLELPCSSPCAGTACRRRAPCNGPCRLETPWCSPPPGTACLHHARYNAERRLGAALFLAPLNCPLRAPGSENCKFITST